MQYKIVALFGTHSKVEQLFSKFELAKNKALELEKLGAITFFEMVPSNYGEILLEKVEEMFEQTKGTC